ncbi:MAG: hypothetical protein ABJD07_02260 [Gemmatimonadaceae bacterium]
MAIERSNAQLARLLYGIGSESVADSMLMVDGTINFVALQAHLYEQEMTPLILKFDRVEMSEEGMAMANAA